VFKFIKSCCGQVGLFFHLLASYFRLMKGVWKISYLKPPIVTVFGGSKLSQDHPYTKKAYALAQKLVLNNISVITGGGPGIMEAVNCGAYPNDTGAKSIGVAIKSLVTEGHNKCADMVVVKHFFIRKWLLTRYATAFAVFPGGFGTADELFEIATLMQVKRLKNYPIVLIQKDYWKPLLEWIEQGVKEGLILKEDADLIFVTDDLEEAFLCLKQEVKLSSNSKE
jgi:hypothetical protein